MKPLRLLRGARSAATPLLFIWALLTYPVVAQSQSSVLLNDVQTVAASSQGVPIEHSFTIVNAGTYQLTLTDLGAAATPSTPLASLQLAVTSGSTIVGTPLTSAGTTQFTATPGTYVVRVVGAPQVQSGAPVLGSGPFGVQIINTADNSQPAGASFSDTLALPPSSTPNVGVLNDTFTVTASGNYTVTLADLKFPQALTVGELALTAQGSTSLLGSLVVDSNGSAATATTPPVALQANTTYSIVAFGQGATVANAGLFAVVVRDGGGNVAYTHTVPVGSVTSLGAVALTATGYTLTFTDLAFPAALTSGGAAVTLNDSVAGSVTGTGNASFTASSTQYQVFAVGTAASTPGAGSYNVDLRPTGGSTPALSVAQTVTTPGSTTAPQAYSFNATIPSAGSYNVQLADYQLPQALTSVSMIAVQGGAALGGALTAPGTLNVSAAAGSMSMLVFAQAPSAGSVFGLFVNPSAGGSAAFETTQGVGALFTSQKVTVATAGSYVANVTDVGFPAKFASLNVLVTQGTTLVGSVLAGGSLPFTATTGDYFVTFTAQPSSTAKAGTYAINVAPPPPVPTVSLTSSVSHVSSGGNATLTWSSQNATSCTASNAWSGSEPLSGTASTGALTASSTFTLTCTGPGGTTPASVTITIDQTSSGSGHGGGGAIDLSVLVALALVGLVRARAPLRRGEH